MVQHFIGIYKKRKLCPGALLVSTPPMAQHLDVVVGLECCSDEPGNSGEMVSIPVGSTIPSRPVLLLFLTLVALLIWPFNHSITAVEDDIELDEFLYHSQKANFTPAQTYSYLIEEPDFCRRHPRVRIIAYVHSSISRVQERQETRKTWANPVFYPFGKMGVVFFVGRSKNENETKIVEEESKQYHDIIQGNYEDEYSSLTLKSLSALKWIWDHCSSARWTLHADDDILINHYNLWEFVSSSDRKNLKNQIICHVFGSSPVLRRGRYQVPYKQYPFAKYPDYCSGFAWLARTSDIFQLLKDSDKVPYLWVDDAWLTGVLAREAGLQVSKAYNHLFEVKLTNPSQLMESRIFYHVQSGNRSTYWKKLLKLF